MRRICSGFGTDDEIHCVRSDCRVKHLRQSANNGISPNGQDISVEFGFVAQTLKRSCDALMPVAGDDHQTCKNSCVEHVD